MSLKGINRSNSWKDFISEVTSYDSKQRGNAFELLTELFLQVDPVYRTKLKTVWHETNIPPRIRAKLGLPVQDIGVDLIAESNDGRYWAIQCKYHHDSNKNVTRNEINSFITTTQVVCKGKFDVCLGSAAEYQYYIKMTDSRH